jgi:hypothetical protein
MKMFILWIVSIVALQQAQIAHAQTVTDNYKLTIKSDLKMKVKGQKEQVVTAETNLGYYHLCESKKLTVGLFDLEVKAAQGGTTVMDVFQNKDQLRDGKTTVKLADANDDLKEILNDSFAAPIAEFKKDQNGALSEQKTVAKSGAKSLVDNGQIENVIFLHPPFFEDKKEWSSPTKFSLGNGNFAHGDLNYKFKSRQDDKVTVEVSGELEPTRKQSMFDIVDGKYEVVGSQVYDLTAKRWDTADIDLNIYFGLAVEGKTAVECIGEMDISMKSVTKEESDSGASKAEKKEAETSKTSG